MELRLEYAEANYPAPLLALLRKVGYKPGSGLVVSKRTADCFLISPFIKVLHVSTGQSIDLFAAQVVCVPDSTPEEIVRAIFRAFERLEIHECAEQFTFGGTRIYDPHVRRTNDFDFGESDAKK